MDAGGIIERTRVGLPVVIRRTRADDLPALEWFGQYTPHREIIRTTFAMQERGEGVMLLADVNGFPAGQVWLDFVRKRRQRRATLWALRVFQPFQRSGLGTRLVAAAESVVAARGLPEIELGVDRDNAGVMAFYERLGYVPSGTERGSYRYRTPDGRTVDVTIDQWLMSKAVGKEAAAARRRTG